jgi:hypothetical protein
LWERIGDSISRGDIDYILDDKSSMQLIKSLMTALGTLKGIPGVEINRALNAAEEDPESAQVWMQHLIIGGNPK